MLAHSAAAPAPGQPARPTAQHPHARIALLPTPADPGQRHRTMDIEQVNAIGLLLADLSERTEQLRGYL